MKTKIYTIGLLLIVVGCLMMVGCQNTTADQVRVADRTIDQVAMPSNADDVLIVDCLLPGQVRKLGRMTYLSPRRPEKTTAFDCGLKGGEYTAFDRSDYQTALSVWLPEAQQGDQLAQTYVGEIYMRGLGTEPNYKQAAKWFEKAADQNFKRAQINLGYLFEKGLGVPQNSKRAINLYREATGLKQALAYESDVQLTEEERTELEKLRQEIVKSRKEAQHLRQEIDRIKDERNLSESMYRQKLRDINQENRQLKEARLDLQKNRAHMASRSEMEQLNKDLKIRRVQIEDLMEQEARLQLDISRMEQRKTTLSATQQSEKTKLLSEISKQTDILSNKRAEVNAISKQINHLEQRQSQLSEVSAALLAKEQELQRREEKLGQQRQEAEKLGKTIAALDLQAQSYREKLDGYKEKIANLPGPEIEIIDPRPLDTRSKKVLQVQTEKKEYQFVGKVTAPAGLHSFRINDDKYTVKKNGLFDVIVSVTSDTEKQVKMVAVDEQGKIGHYMLTITRPNVAANQSPKNEKRKVATTKLDFGRYYALLIGNNDYSNLPPLKTAVNDATTLARTLKNQYGYETTLLTNASRQEIYKALDTFRVSLTEKDNFLIYYAGHGELDKKNHRGYWLPIDADSDSHVNSISNQTVTDILNLMSVKQAMIIADTCYSGIMTRSVIAMKEAGMSDDARLKWYAKIASERCRTVLSSGGLRPVLDAGIGEHSIFASALLAVLAENGGILEATELHRLVRSKVTASSKALGFEQVPQYAANLHAGHQAGDFLFVPAQYQL